MLLYDNTFKKVSIILIPDKIMLLLLRGEQK